jgi:hypothetical protein
MRKTHPKPGVPYDSVLSPIPEKLILEAIKDHCSFTGKNQNQFLDQLRQESCWEKYRWLATSILKRLPEESFEFLVITYELCNGKPPQCIDGIYELVYEKLREVADSRHNA